MSDNTSVAAARFGMSSLADAGCVLGMLAVAPGATAHTAAVATYKPFIDARNDARGGVGAWRPPV